MGWNTSAMFVHGMGPDEAVGLIGTGVFAATGEWVAMERATSGLQDGTLFAAEAGGWAQVWDPSMTFAPVCKPPGAGLAVVFSSVASTYAFTLFDGGVEVRQWVSSDGDLVIDEGTPLAAEAGVDIPAWGPDEDFLWTVIEAVTGRGHGDELRFQVYRPS